MGFALIIDFIGFIVVEQIDCCFEVSFLQREAFVSSFHRTDWFTLGPNLTKVGFDQISYFEASFRYFANQIDFKLDSTIQRDRLVVIVIRTLRFNK